MGKTEKKIKNILPVTRNQRQSSSLTKNSLLCQILVTHENVQVYQV